MRKTIGLMVLFVTILFMLPDAGHAGWLIYHKPAFHGRVIDAETKEPIEGAVVVASYLKTTLGPAHSGSSVFNVRETLTDKAGEFHIPSYTTIIQPFSWSEWSDKVTFIIYKPGYGSYPTYHSFLIYPIKESLERLSREGTTREEKEGIIYEKGMSMMDEKSKVVYFDKFGGNVSPFIPLKNPFGRIKSLDIPFDADVLNTEPFWTLYKQTFGTYSVVGLPKLQTVEGRKQAHPGPVGDERLWPQQKEFIRAIRKDWEYLTGKPAGDLYKLPGDKK
ncbi:MAG: carboxypeptidase-like regulatory domain-containing protein [Nitrospirota bacterium]